MMDAIILAGGFGTRLQSVVSDVPKPMAPVNGKPFLEILLKSLEKKGIRRVILSVGYKAEIIMNYFGSSYGEIELLYEVEDTPLGTGGAVRAALSKCITKKVLILNGDTYINLDSHFLTTINAMNDSNSIIFGVEISDKVRYGSIEKDQSFIVTGFVEKGCAGPGVINSGYYIFPKKEFLENSSDGAFSLETIFLPKLVYEKKLRIEILASLFIDIGIPEDYKKAAELLRNI